MGVFRRAAIRATARNLALASWSRLVESCFQADIATGVRHADRAGHLINSTRWLVTSIVRLTPTNGLPSPYGNLLLITATLSIRLVTSAFHAAVILTAQAITTFARQDDPAVFIHRRVDQDPLEEHLVQLLPQVIRCRHIQPVAVLQQIERLLHMRARTSLASAW